MHYAKLAKKEAQYGKESNETDASDAAVILC